MPRDIIYVFTNTGLQEFVKGRGVETLPVEKGTEPTCFPKKLISCGTNFDEDLIKYAVSTTPGKHPVYSILCYPYSH
jgi:hypothetical protein